MSQNLQEKETRENLLRLAKKEVKQIMEIAVTVKFVHEDNSCITSLCAAIESCLLHGLKKTPSQFFKAATTMSLVQKIAKSCEPAQQVVLMCDNYEKSYCNSDFLNSYKKNSAQNTTNSSNTGNIISRKLFSTKSNDNQSNHNNSNNNKAIPMNNFSPTFYKGSVCYKFLWIRLALLNKLFGRIIEYLIENSKELYHPYALIADPVDGLIFNSLLIGPCALEYTRVKTIDFLWTEQNADELIQRHKMQNAFKTQSYEPTRDDSVPSMFQPKSLTQRDFNGSKSCYHSLTSPKIKLGIRASLIAKRKASINALDDINNNSSKTTPPGAASSTTASTNKRDDIITPQTPDFTKKNVNLYAVQRTNSYKSETQMSKFSTPLSYNSSQRFSDQISETPNGNCKKTANNAKEYVESLHQNTKSQLIYGKNNVIVSQKEIELPGYLSLHLHVNGMVLKWTPNQMINGSQSSQDDSPKLHRTKSHAWDFVMFVDINTIVYLHCHQETGDDRISIVLVAHDGIQYPPILFPKGSHFLAFLTCFETGLSPSGRLDPSLLVNEGTEYYHKLLSQEHIDFVFQIVSSNSNASIASILNNEKLKQSKSNLAELNLKPNASLNQIIQQKETTLKSLISAMFLSSKLNTSPDDLLKSETAVSPNSQNTSIIVDNTTNGVFVIPKTPLNQINMETSTPTSESGSYLKSEFNKAIKSVSIRNSLKVLCETVKKQILVRAFYGWLVYHRHLKTVGTHLTGLVHLDSFYLSKLDSFDLCSYLKENKKLDTYAWHKILDAIETKKCLEETKKLFFNIVYSNGVDGVELRKAVWPFLLEHYTFEMTKAEREQVDEENANQFKKLMSDWSRIEETVKTNEKFKKNTTPINSDKLFKQNSTLENDSGISINDTNNSSIFNSPRSILSTKRTPKLTSSLTKSNRQTWILMKNHDDTENKDLSNNNEVFLDDSGLNLSLKKSLSMSSLDSQIIDDMILKTLAKSIVDKAVFKASLLINRSIEKEGINFEKVPCLLKKSYFSKSLNSIDKLMFQQSDKKDPATTTESADQTTSSATKKKPTNYTSQDVLECFATNMHRIDKDVTRCDRNFWYFTTNENLTKLKNVIYTYVWENLDIGYIQGMCDLVAPLLVIFNDEAIVYSCFKNLMKRMSANFPHGNAMDQNFSNMRALIQIMDSDLFDHMYRHGDYTHFYFSYRWFLLDFKREFIYDDVFKLWETIWSAKHVCTQQFYLFIALALVETYRDIILDNNMDFTDILKFFNEMTEKHDFDSVIKLAKNLVNKLQNLIKSKNNSNQ